MGQAVRRRRLFNGAANQGDGRPGMLVRRVPGVPRQRGGAECARAACQIGGRWHWILFKGIHGNCRAVYVFGAQPAIRKRPPGAYSCRPLERVMVGWRQLNDAMQPA